MRDELFIRGKVPMTKEEVRAVTMGRLELFDASNMLDIGGGTGSLSIEAAVQNPNLKIDTIEINQAGVELIKLNKNKFKTKNVNVIHGIAPEDIPNKIYDRVVIGGSKGKLDDIFKKFKEILSEEAIVVINCITLETFNSAIKLLEDKAFKEVRVSNISVSRMDSIGSMKYFKPINPAYVISAIYTGR